MHCRMAALLAAACLWPSLVAAVPAPGSRIIIDTDADVVINKVVSTVTTTAGAACGCIVGSTSGAPIERVGGSFTSSQPWSPGATVLAPAVPPYIDTSQRANLMPHVSAQLFYVQPQAPGSLGTTSNASIAAVSVPQMNYPTVNLLTTNYVSGLACSKPSATVTFSDQQAYQLAATNWTQAIPFVLVTYHAECGSAYKHVLECKPAAFEEYASLRILGGDSHATV